MRRGECGHTRGDGRSVWRRRAQPDIVGVWHARGGTANIDVMLVTLDVSKLSGWLNNSADCRSKRGAMRRGEM
eukprot:scaffold43012_cov49-Phaeocystis_antarctica.AAC.9